MGRVVKVDVEQLRAGAKTLKKSASGSRPSADEADGFGSSVARAAVSRFEGYWVRGQSAIDELVVGSAGALEQAADSYQRRDSEDAVGMRGDRGGFHGF